VRRIEDRALLTGAGRFTDNLLHEGAAFIAFQRSPHAHARIVAIDADAARAMPGVLAVYTGAELVDAGVQAMPTTTDFRRADGRTTVTPARRALAHEFARFVGEPVAAVVAETREAARDAAEAVAVDYEDLPAVVGARAAVADGAPAVTTEAPDNIAAEMRHGDAARAAEAFARAAVRVELDLVNQRVAPVSMEPRSIAASFDAGSGRLTVRISNQMPTAVAAGLSGALPGLAQDRVHVLIGDVGGGFGMKTGIYPEDIVVAHAARTLGRGVRWQADRGEDFLSASHGRDVSSRAELALDAGGKVLALRVHSLANVGAYATGTVSSSSC
jgi:carbon-monoxide dehydrogenase large subunit